MRWTRLTQVITEAFVALRRWPRAGCLSVMAGVVLAGRIAKQVATIELGHRCNRHCSWRAWKSRGWGGCDGQRDEGGDDRATGISHRAIRRLT